MLNINNKIYLNKRFSVYQVELNSMNEIALAHILAHAYSIVDTHIDDIEFDDVLFITDTTPTDLLLESSDFKEAGVTMQRSNFPKRIRTTSAYNFNNITDEHQAYKAGVNLVVVGFINTIPEHIFSNIMELFGRGVNYAVFGDSIVDAPESNSYFMRYLTNSSVSVRLDYDNCRISDKKKINNTLSKLRKDLNNLSEITSSNYVSLTSLNTIDIPTIANYLEDKTLEHEYLVNTVVVPKRFYGKVNSLYYRFMTSKSSLDLTIGDSFYVKHHWTVEQNKNKYVIPPLTKITILQIGRQAFIQGHRCYLCDLAIEDPSGEGKPLIVNSAAIDFTDYISNFSRDDHPENWDDFEDLLKNVDYYQRIHDSDILKIIFAPILNSDMTKYYRPVGKTLAYIEMIERSYYSSDTNWYKLFAHTIDKIDIIFSDEFTDITY